MAHTIGISYLPCRKKICINDYIYGLHYEEKPGKNFLLENIKKLREIQEKLRGNLLRKISQIIVILIIKKFQI
ncbi:hypothetical protein GE061_011063 [Apolygus lucorum]|uniref:Uncharacterized protein n=1 Tax=Apolygus lucorum TaxID=248454 RepID=A0A8S9XXK7_APOLU|nr:hypothetical protein GE061_011063 [Apolygus lucorum]